VSTTDHGVTSTASTVHGWSRARLPFQPSGTAREYRDKLQVALSQLEVPTGSSLLATSSGPGRHEADIDNVLLYNVGTGSLSPLLGGGVHLSKVELPGTVHRLDYGVGPLPAPPCGDVVATVSTPVGAWQTAGDWWGGLRPRLETVRDQPPLLGPFAVDVTLFGPWTGASTLAAIKPMLDGLCSSLHAQDRTATAAQERVRALLGDGAWERLIDGTPALLGTRQVVRPRGNNGISWNPADERCTSITVRRVPGDERRMSARIHCSR
jgi:hypothetical protein